MNKKKRAYIIEEMLENLYPKPPIPLYHVNNLTLLIAVLLSAQSRDIKVNELTKVLFLKASNAIDFIELGELKIYDHIKELGLAKTKAKNIYMLSLLIHNKFQGSVPNSFKELESLPGVGHKTASVVMAQAFGFDTFPIDTHIHRLAQRWELTKGNSVKQTEKDLKNIFPKNKWNKLHLQIIFYGREYCSAKGCDGTVCILCKKLFPKRSKPVMYKKA
tara:strand:+ start:1054 stop:1707 length:654 start_codon:yes stop_codon:yes gene_type:complete